MHLPLTGDFLYDCVGAVISIIVGGMIWGKANNKYGGLILAAGFVWVLFLLRNFAGRV